MNRAHTVWLDQLSSSNSTQLPDQILSSEVQSSLPRLRPQSPGETLLSALLWVWRMRHKGYWIVIICLFLRRLRAWSHSHPTLPAPSIVAAPPPPHALLPSYIPSATARGVWLYTRTWRVERSRGVVFILHAHREHSGRYECVASSFNSAGYSVFSLDHQGHGRSLGERFYVEAFQHYVQDYMEFIDRTSKRRMRSGSKYLHVSSSSFVLTLFLTLCFVCCQQCLRSMAPPLSLSLYSYLVIVWALLLHCRYPVSMGGGGWQPRRRGKRRE